MDTVIVLLAALILLSVVWYVGGPLRRPARDEDATEDPAIADLEARKEAKYREIRDAELDHAAGKLSDEDWGRQDAQLRAEAIAILDELDRARGTRAGGPERGDG